MNIWTSFVDSLEEIRLFEWWSPSTLFQYVPPAVWKMQWIYVGVIGLCFIAGVLFIFLKIRPNYKNRWLYFFWTNFILGIFLFFLRWQRVPYLGMDFIRTIQELAMIFWLNSIFWYRRNGYVTEVVSEKAAERKKKYLPQNG